MKKETDPQQLDREAAKHQAIADELRLAAQQARESDVAISPHTKLPVSHPESQAVERIHYEMQTSLCGASTPDEVEAVTRRLEDTAKKQQEDDSPDVSREQV